MADGDNAVAADVEAPADAPTDPLAPTTGPVAVSALLLAAVGNAPRNVVADVQDAEIQGPKAS